MKKTYTDQCLADYKDSDGIDDRQVADHVPELARRLKEACEALREACFEGSTKGKDLADELEAPLENNE